MQKLLSGPRALALAACAVLAFSASANADIVFNTTTAASGAGSTQNTQHYLQQLTLAGPAGSYTLNSFPSFGINWTGSAGGLDQGVLFNFYTNLNLAPGATNVLTGATQFASVGFLLANPGMDGNFVYTLPLTVPIVTPGATFGIEVFLTDDTGTAFSATEIMARFTLGGPPSVGSSPGFVWSDADSNGTFTGAEQTKFGNATAANIRMSIDATPPAVPEPASWALMFTGAGALALAKRRSSRKA